MLWVIYWKNRKRSGMSTETAETKEAASEKCVQRIETKYHWQGKCRVTSCEPAKEEYQPRAIQESNTRTDQTSNGA